MTGNGVTGIDSGHAVSVGNAAEGWPGDCIRRPTPSGQCRGAADFATDGKAAGIIAVADR